MKLEGGDYGPLGIILEVIIALILVLLMGPFGILIARKLGLIDMPGKAAHKKHAAPTPLAGGIVLGVTLPILFSIFILARNHWAVWIMLCAGIIFVFGVIDDRYGLSAPQKFLGQIPAALIAMASGVSVKILENFSTPLAPGVVTFLNWGISLFWIVGITNAFNLLDSMDGLVAGVSIISAGFFMVMTTISGQAELTQVSALLFGVSIGLYFYNRPPARFFLGDAGSQLLGFLLAIVGILYNPPDMPQGSTWFLPILLLGIPIFDTSLVIVSRLRRHKPIFEADLSHTYHRLLRIGIPPNRAVLVIHTAALLLSVIAYGIIFLPPQWATFVFAAIVLLGAGLIMMLVGNDTTKL